MIPNRIIFIWLGEKLPWTGAAAIRSAWQVQKPDSIWILHNGIEHKGEAFEMLRDIKGLEWKLISDDYFKDLNDNFITLELFHSLESPASRANLLRLAVLYKYGGVYLDTDVIAIRPWNDLLQMKGFCGLEPVALPQSLFKSINPLRWILSGLQMGFRECCARLPRGYQLFRLFEGTYPAAVNNAVIGTEAHHPLIAKAFEMILEMNPKERLKRFRLGTHLMQKLTQNKSSKTMTVLPASYFYPLGPEISAHWFKKGSAAKLNDMILANTRVIHWYNSVESRFLKTKLNRHWVDENPDTAFSELIRKQVDNLYL